MSLVVVGIDGGGSKTRVIVADEHAAQLADIVGPAGAVRPGEAERSADVIAALVSEALASCGHGDATPRVACAGLAGVGREVERLSVLAALRRRDLAEEVDVRSDAAIALEDAFGDGPGILLIAGTGSIAYGRGPTEATGRCGGWGPAIGDEGGGAWIGRRALGIIAAASDGREPETALVGAILTHLQVDDVPSLIPWASSATPKDFASLVPIIAAAAERDDVRANTLLALAVEELALHVRALARQLFVDERATVPVAFSGGLLGKGGPLRKRVEHRLKSVVPGAHIHGEVVVPARGAVRAALKLIGAHPTQHAAGAAAH
jgi:glucosamine kinase